VPGDPPGDRLRASLALPVVANVLTAKLGLFALDQGLSVTGQADGVVPLFRFEYLRDKAKELTGQVQAIETRMLPIQFELDDFAEAVSAIKRPLAAQQAELEAVRQRIGELTQALAAQAQVEQALDRVVIALDKAEDECECDWFCWLVAIVAAGFIYVVMVALVASVVAALADPFIAGMVLVFGEELGGAAVFGVGLLVYSTFTCENVGTIGRSMKAARAGVQGAIAENEAELHHALLTRDILIASINALSDQLEQAYQSNAARVLDAKTLDVIQAQYNILRQSLLTRAQAMAKLAENAFNFERDADSRLIRDAYYDPSLKGYTAAETLLHDLGGFDHIDLTGRTRKALQLSQMVSLRKHSPLSFLALAAMRTGRFTTTLADFDRWYPGTYLQRIKEVRVEVLVDGEPVPARGYLSNDGVSLVRFADPDNKRPVDNIRVFDEPDPDLAKLCYKRLQRRRHVDTMAFPAFESQLHAERMRRLQNRERNFFENVGLESTWLIELLPDQPFDLARVSDVRVWFQYEALFDENIKRVLEPKRYAGRREMAAVPIGQLIRDGGGTADFSTALTFKTTRALFDGPAIEKTIVDTGFAVRLKDGKSLNGAAGLEVSYEGRRGGRGDRAGPPRRHRLGGAGRHGPGQERGGDVDRQASEPAGGPRDGRRRRVVPVAELRVRLLTTRASGQLMNGEQTLPEELVPGLGFRPCGVQWIDGHAVRQRCRRPSPAGAVLPRHRGAPAGERRVGWRREVRRPGRGGRAGPRCLLARCADRGRG
jgi:tetratricopeptide (TPR) repeat protein